VSTKPVAEPDVEGRAARRSIRDVDNAYIGDKAISLGRISPRPGADVGELEPLQKEAPGGNGCSWMPGAPGFEEP
jgi:hypothetical protein